MVLSSEQQHAGSHDAETGSFSRAHMATCTHLTTEERPPAASLRAKYVPAALLRQPIKMRKFKRSDLEVHVLSCGQYLSLEKVANKIGSGAYGGVWQATVVDTDKEVVVKVVWPDQDLDPEDFHKNGCPTQERLEAFRREIEMMEVAGAHPNIISILGATPDSRVIVLEEAMTDLHTIIGRQRYGLNLPIITRWTRDILRGVAYLHSVFVVHRDLKPANILIFQDMTAKIGDFGLAREFSSTERMMVGREICTLWYRAPELLMGAAKYCPKIDVWPVGCIFLEMLIGKNLMCGRVSDTCKCKKVTHSNYNSDQLYKIFGLVGSPNDPKFLSSMDCYAHFRDWPIYPSRLSKIIRNHCTPERFKASPNASVPDDRELEEICNGLTAVIKGLLTLDPSARLSAHQASTLQVLEDALSFADINMDAIYSRQAQTSQEMSPAERIHLQVLAVWMCSLPFDVFSRLLNMKWRCSEDM
eukprot:757591-Hanusia_phi.AAC.2